jgi:ABC-2 type transport system permease protein
MFANVFKIIAFILKRERITSTIWILGLVGFAALIAVAYPTIIPNKEAMLTMATTMDTPAMRSMMGPVYGLNYGISALSVAMIMAQECLVWFMVAIAIMNIFFINRYTRVEEETGRAETLASLPVGRLASGLAVIKVSFLLNILIALLSAVSLRLINIDGTTFAGCLTYGFAIGIVGLFFAGITYLCSQFFSTARAVTATSFALFLILFIMRAVGDMLGDSPLSLISPLGLALRTYTFYENNIMPIMIILLESIILFLLGFWVCTKRDIGAGVFPARKGKMHASKMLRGTTGLVWRLEKGTIIGWIIGLFALGASYGSVVPQLEEFVSSSDMMQQMISASGGNGIIDNFYAMIMIIASLIAAVPIITLINKIVSEEKRGRIEQILAKPVSRNKLLGAYILIAFICIFVFQLSSSVGLWIGAGGNGIELPRLIGAAFAYIPALLVFLGFCVCLCGLLPRAASLAWLLFAFSFYVVYFGRILDLPNFVAKISPFGSIPQLPVQDFEVFSSLVLTVIAIVFAGIGIFRYSKRDMM